MISTASWRSELVGDRPTSSEAISPPSPKLAVEPVEARHAQALAELFERNRVPVVSDPFDPFPLTADEAERIALQPRRDAYFVASLQGELIAMSMLRGFDEGFEVPSFGVFVDHLHHGEGIGRRLTTWTVEEARRRGHPAVRLSVYANNVGALGLYRSLGFEERERNPVARAGGKDEKILMTKLLGSRHA
jgi:ribosomal protein S18 acetylase RimI-like enzyme